MVNDPQFRYFLNQQYCSLLLASGDFLFKVWDLIFLIGVIDPHIPEQTMARRPRAGGTGGGRTEGGGGNGGVERAPKVARSRRSGGGAAELIYTHAR